jgi:hypothetical protein
MDHPDLVTIDEEMYVIHLHGRLHFIVERVGFFLPPAWRRRRAREW